MPRRPRRPRRSREPPAERARQAPRRRWPAAPIAPRASGGSANPPVSPTRAAPQEAAPRRAKGRSLGAAARSPGCEPGRAVRQSRIGRQGRRASARSSRPRRAADDANEPVWRAAVGVLSSRGRRSSLTTSPRRGRASRRARARLPRAPAPSAAPVREIDVDLSPGGLENVSMTMRLTGDKLSVVIRAASSQTLGSIEGARDAIADRMAAIGQPLDSLIVKQTGVNADGNANGNGPPPTTARRAANSDRRKAQASRDGSNDASSSRRGAGRDRSF